MNPKPEYRPGLHILASLRAHADLLSDMDRCHGAFDRIVAGHGLHKVGEAYHAFEGGGFTAVVALTESHLSVHTWPEYGLATFDVFLSNFMRDNSETVRAVYADVVAHFDAVEVSKTEVQR